MRIAAAVFFIFWGWCGVVAADEIWVGNRAFYEVTVARTEDELQTGLMKVQKLPENQGMLFDLRAYAESGVAMWMKDTYIALDMLFINCAFEVVYIYENATPLSLEPIKSPREYCYVLEINGGQAARYGLKAGDKVSAKTSD